MGKLDVHIRHGGGDSHVIWIILAVVAVVLLSGSAAAISSALLTGLVILAAVLGGGFVIGVAAWILTRGHRQRAAEAMEQYRQDREEAYHQRQLDMVRAKAQIKAHETVTMAHMISEAIRYGHQPTWPDVPYQPPTIKAEVIKRNEDTE